jgi:hypothetical protein
MFYPVQDSPGAGHNYQENSGSCGSNDGGNFVILSGFCVSSFGWCCGGRRRRRRCCRRREWGGCVRLPTVPHDAIHTQLQVSRAENRNAGGRALGDVVLDAKSVCRRLNLHGTSPAKKYSRNITHCNVIII